MFIWKIENFQVVACSYGFSTCLLGIVLEWNGGAVKPKQFDGALASVKAWKTPGESGSSTLNLRPSSWLTTSHFLSSIKPWCLWIWQFNFRYSKLLTCRKNIPYILSKNESRKKQYWNRNRLFFFAMFSPFFTRVILTSPTRFEKVGMASATSPVQIMERPWAAWITHCRCPPGYRTVFKKAKFGITLLVW